SDVCSSDLMFAGLSIIVLGAQALLQKAGIVESGDLVLLASGRGDVAVPTRLFIVVFFATYAYYAYGNRWRRVAIGTALLGKFLATCLVFDLLGWLLHHLQILSLHVLGQQIASALVALALFPHTLLRQAQLPAALPGPIHPATPRSAYPRLLVPLILA